MKEEYENRLQRAKNKLNEEKARRKSREALRDDSSYCSEMSKASRTSFTSEYSRASSKLQDTSKLPRSEWRNKARAVIERGKSFKEQESDPDQDDVSRKEREAQIDSLVERNALLNERERMLKVENHLLDAAEAAAKAEELERAEAYLGKDIEDDGEDFSLNSDSQQSQQSGATTRTTATCRAKRIQDKEADELNRSFQEAKKVWQGRCKPDKTGLEGPTPVKSNTYKTTRAKKSMPSLKIEDGRSGANSTDDVMHEEDLMYMDSDDTIKTDDVVSPESPVSVKSIRSTRSVKSAKSAKSEQMFNSRGRAVRSNVFEAPSSPESAKSDFISGAKEIRIIRNNSLLENERRDENIDADNGPSSASDRRSTSSYRQKRDDPLATYEKLTEREPPPSQSYRVQSSSASVSSQRSKHSRNGNEDIENTARKVVDTGSRSYRVKSSSASDASERSKYSSRRSNEDPDPSSSMSVSSQRSKYSSSRSRGDKAPSSSISVSSQRSKHSSHNEQESREQSSSATVSSQRSTYSSSRNHRPCGASVSSQRSKRSIHHDDEFDQELDEDDFANMLPDELSIPMIIADLENGENQPPSQKRELSYREKSAMLASMENSMADDSGADEEGPRDRNLFRQHGQKVKKHHQSPYMSVALYGSGTQPQPQPNVVLPALKEQKNLYNTKAGTNTALRAQQGPESLELSNLINENRELKARLERERTRRSQLDDKTTNLQLEVHQKGEEISQLRKRKDVSASHKEQLYKLEDALQESNRRLAAVMDENARIRQELEEEHARCGRLESQGKHYQTKLKKRSDEVVGLAKELKKKEDRYSQALLEERHLREVAESQLAKACQHINISEREQNEELDELEKENEELRRTVKRLEVYLKQKLEKERQANTKNRRQSGGSNQDGISSKPTWTTAVSAVSEITTDFECDELNSSQMGEI